MFSDMTAALQTFDRSGLEVEQQLRSSGVDRFRREYARGICWRIWSMIRGRNTDLKALPQTGQGAGNARYVGVRSVPLDQIRGSEGRVKDFDARFFPRRGHTIHRWASLLTAREMGVVLPPVKLIRVDDGYYVRDGHHRISVAQALGQLEIEAEVTEWM